MSYITDIQFIPISNRDNNSCQGSLPYDKYNNFYPQNTAIYNKNNPNLNFVDIFRFVVQ